MEITTPFVIKTTPHTKDPEAAGQNPCPEFKWTDRNTEIIGIILWIVMIIILIGNLSCFYAVWKNIKKIMEHPFFQSNVLCIYLSVVDILLVLFVGIPTATAYTAHSSTLSNSVYSSIANMFLNYLVWLQLVLIVGICIDRAGHITRPMRYAFGLTMTKTMIGIILSTILPFIATILPEVIIIADDPGIIGERALCFKVYTETDEDSPLVYLPECGKVKVHLHRHRMFLSCTPYIDSDSSEHFKNLRTWQHVGEWLIIVLSVLALSLSNILIVYKLYKSPSFNQRKQAMERSMRINSIVTVAQVLIILASVIPYRHWIMSRTYTNPGEGFGQFHAIFVRLIVFFGPVCNPWLYPIRMASIRTFLRMRKNRLVHSVSQSLRLRSLQPSGTQHTVLEDEKKSFIKNPSAQNETLATNT